MGSRTYGLSNLTSSYDHWSSVRLESRYWLEDARSSELGRDFAAKTRRATRANKGMEPTAQKTRRGSCPGR